MQYLVYRSTALVPPTSPECRSIVDVAIRANARFGLTGFLHAEDGLFIQYLEGPGDSLWVLYEHLHDDPRHEDLVLIGEGFLRTRRFCDWRMGYSSTGVLSFPEFLAEVSDGRSAASELEAIAFLMATSQRIDLGICEAP